MFLWIHVKAEGRLFYVAFRKGHKSLNMTTKNNTKSFTFWPVLFLLVACALLLVLTFLSRKGIRINTFLAMMAVSGLFGLTMVGFSLELVHELTWNIIWKPFVISIVVVAILVFSGWLVELGKPDIVAE